MSAIKVGECDDLYTEPKYSRIPTDRNDVSCNTLILFLFNICVLPVPWSFSFFAILTTADTQVLETDFLLPTIHNDGIP